MALLPIYDAHKITSFKIIPKKGNTSCNVIAIRLVRQWCKFTSIKKLIHSRMNTLIKTTEHKSITANGFHIWNKEVKIKPLQNTYITSPARFFHDAKSYVTLRGPQEQNTFFSLG